MTDVIANWSLLDDEKISVGFTCGGGCPVCAARTIAEKATPTSRGRAGG